MSSDERSPWLTTREASRRARCGEKVLFGAIRAGRLKAVRVGKGWRFHVEWIDAWLQARATPVNPDAGPAIAWPR